MRLIVAAVAGACSCATHAADVNDLTELSLEELGNIPVTSVSGRSERLGEAPASIHVITADAIRRSGAATLPEALRLAPNLQVARIDAGQYAISARGFNDAIADKLLVLIDGRTVYAPFFSGVFWDQQAVMLDDVDRIEVISGPGATLWGANAVNGVINVITRTAAQTLGANAAVTAGNLDSQITARYGAKLGADAAYRLYAMADRTENTRTASGNAVADGRTRQQVGFRADWARDRDQLTLQGDTYTGRSEHRGFFGPFELTPIKISGANLLARWSRQLANNSSVSVQAYVDHTERRDALLYSPQVDIVDVQFQHGFQVRNHRVLWGAGHRRSRDDIEPGVFFGFVPASRTLRWTNVFAQDEIALTERTELTLGTKLENNDYTGTEALPSVRLAWQPSNDHLAWAALSRAVRAPARLDRELVLPPTPPYIIAGGPDFVSEVADVAEVGWRAQASPDFNYSMTLFHHEWSRLRSGQVPPNAHVQNMIAGHTQGIETWATWQAAPWVRLSAGATVLRKRLHVQAGSTDPVGPAALGDDPSHQWSVRASFNLPRRQDLDVALRHVGALPVAQVPSYTAVDARYGWLLRDNLQLSVIGQNLFDRAHTEFGNFMSRTEIGRSIALRLRWAM